MRIAKFPLWIKRIAIWYAHKFILSQQYNRHTCLSTLQFLPIKVQMHNSTWLVEYLLESSHKRKMKVTQKKKKKKKTQFVNFKHESLITRLLMHNSLSLVEYALERKLKTNQG